MKKIMHFILLGMFVLLYFIYDSNGYNYGVNSIFHYQKVPYGLKPKYNFDYPQSFVLLDKDGFVLVGERFRYEQSSFDIKHFLGYGYNDTSIIVKCTDSLNNIKYLVSYIINEKGNKSEPTISFQDIKNIHIQQLLKDYKWFDIDDEKTNNIKFIKYVIIVGFVILLGMIIYSW